MTRKALTILSLVLASGLASSASAQAPAAPAGGGAAPAPPVQGVDIGTARKMMAAAEAAAVAAKANVACAIVDVNGDLVYFMRMDGAAPRGGTSSHGKARAAILFGMPTMAVGTAAREGKPVTATLTLPVAGAWELTPQQGGLPYMKAGKLAGAIGCGGSSPANDEKFAQAGLDAVK